MRENNNTALLGERVILVPYTASMVGTYHAWMVCLPASPVFVRAKLGP